MLVVCKLSTIYFTPRAIKLAVINTTLMNCSKYETVRQVVQSYMYLYGIYTPTNRSCNFTTEEHQRIFICQWSFLTTEQGGN